MTEDTPAPSKLRYSSYWQEAMSHIALVGLSLKLNLQLRLYVISLKEWDIYSGININISYILEDF